MTIFYNIISVSGVGEDSIVECIKSFSDYNDALDYTQKLVDYLSTQKEWQGEFVRIKNYGDFVTFLDTIDPDKFRYIGIIPSKINQ